MEREEAATEEPLASRPPTTKRWSRATYNDQGLVKPELLWPEDDVGDAAEIQGVGSPI